MINFALKTGAVDPNEPDANIKLDPLGTPQLYHSIIVRRVTAYLLDILIVGGLMSVAFVAISLSGLLIFGLGFIFIGPVLFITPLAYHTLLIGGPHNATWGMRFMGIEVRRWPSGRPDLLQAAALTIVFYGSVTLTAWVILAVAFFSNSRRCLHDYFSGTVVVNRHSENGTKMTGEWLKRPPSQNEKMTID